MLKVITPAIVNSVIKYYLFSFVYLPTSTDRLSWPFLEWQPVNHMLKVHFENLWLIMKVIFSWLLVYFRMVLCNSNQIKSFLSLRKEIRTFYKFLLKMFLLMLHWNCIQSYWSTYKQTIYTLMYKAWIYGFGVLVTAMLCKNNYDSINYH